MFPAKVLRLDGQRGMIDLTFRVEHTTLKNWHKTKPII